MRFMMLMIPKGYESAAPGTVPDAKAVEAMMKYNEALQKAGVLLALDGLHPPSTGARVSFDDGTPKVTDGPFAEAKEVLGGYWMIQVRSKEEAIEWAKRCPGAPNEVIELRQVMEMDDFPADVHLQEGARRQARDDDDAGRRAAFRGRAARLARADHARQPRPGRPSPDGLRHDEGRRLRGHARLLDRAVLSVGRRGEE